MVRLIAVAGLLITFGVARADPPATIIGQVNHDRKPVSGARIDINMVSPHPAGQGFAHRVTVTNEAGRFVLVGVLPAELYTVQITFADGNKVWGFLSDVRSGEVRHIASNRQPPLCGTTIWTEPEVSADLPQNTFIWPLRTRRNRITLCE